jgi:hypothetical protein
MPEDPGAPQAFHELVGDLDYPISSPPTRAGGEMAGCLVGFATHSESPRAPFCGRAL